MPSSPPRPLDDELPSALATLDLVRFAENAPQEGILFFCVENAPREACQTQAGADGTLTFRTLVSGRVSDVQRGAMIITAEPLDVALRHLLPSGLDLTGLLGHEVTVELEQSYRGRGRATIDAEIRDGAGRLILWAHDGRMPGDRDARGLSLRATVDPTGMRLAVRAAELVSLPCPATAAISLGGRDFTFALTRLGADDVGFVMLRR